MSNENKNVVSRLEVNLKTSAPSAESERVIKPEDQHLAHDDTVVSLDANRLEICHQEVEVVPKTTFKPKGRSFKPKPQESTSTGFIMDAPGVFGVGFDGSMMEMFNKADFKD